jgi:hypothetical protein
VSCVSLYQVLSEMSQFTNSLFRQELQSCSVSNYDHGCTEVQGSVHKATILHQIMINKIHFVPLTS